MIPTIKGEKREPTREEILNMIDMLPFYDGEVIEFSKESFPDTEIRWKEFKKYLIKLKDD